MTPGTRIAACAAAVVVAGAALALWAPGGNVAHTSGPAAGSDTEPPAATALPTCTGRDLSIQATLELGTSGTHVVAAYQAGGRLGHHCRLRGRGIRVTPYVYDEHGLVHTSARNLLPGPMTIGPQPGKPGTLPGGTYYDTERPTRTAWCATGGHRYILVVTAPGAQTATARARICG